MAREVRGKKILSKKKAVAKKENVKNSKKVKKRKKVDKDMTIFYVTISIIVVLLILAVVLVSLGNEDETVNNNTNTETSSQGNELRVEMTGTAFLPRVLNVEVGDKVTFINTGNSDVWPASNIHPTHESYPGSSIDKCGTNGESEIFDACESIAPGESYEYTFREIGNWGYHDHLKPGTKGVIIVG